MPYKNKEKQFVRFRENNDWKGETWDFYIPIEGNEEAIEELVELIEKYPNYTLYPVPFSENEVDILVKNENELSYMPRHNKLSGKLDFFDYSDKSLSKEEDPFYKGGIRKYLIK